MRTPRPSHSGARSKRHRKRHKDEKPLKVDKRAWVQGCCRQCAVYPMRDTKVSVTAPRSYGIIHGLCKHLACVLSE